MNKLLNALPNVETFRNCLFDEHYVDKLLSSGELSYANIMTLNAFVAANSDQFKNESTIIGYLNNVYDDIVTTEFEIDKKAQNSIVSNLKLYEFLLDYVKAKFESFNKLLDKGLKCNKCKKYAENALLSIGLSFDAQEVYNTFVEISKPSAKRLNSI